MKRLGDVMGAFENLARFVVLTHKVQGVKRTNLAADGERRENDAEHSFQVAMVAWYLADALNLELDRERLLQYALVHDIAEVYAEDIDPHYSFKHNRAAKEEQESAAMRKLKGEHPKFDELHRAHAHYHAQNDDEAHFVYALDKLLCFMNIHMTNDPYYAVLQLKKGIDMLQDMKNTRHKVKTCRKIRELYDQLMEIVEKKSMIE